MISSAMASRPGDEGIDGCGDPRLRSASGTARQARGRARASSARRAWRVGERPLDVDAAVDGAEGGGFPARGRVGIVKGRPRSATAAPRRAFADLEADEAADEDRDIELSDEHLATGEQPRTIAHGNDVAVAERRERGEAEIEDRRERPAVVVADRSFEQGSAPDGVGAGIRGLDARMGEHEREAEQQVHVDAAEQRFATHPVVPDDRIEHHPR